MDLCRLLNAVKAYSKQDTSIIEKAYEFAFDAHQGQSRASGEEFFQHPFSVAMILTETEVDCSAIAAALLHDVVEDTSVSLAQIKEAFGAEIATLVDGVTKLGRLEFKSPVEEQVENLRKMFLAMAEDLRVIIIKMADRLHNMRTLDHLPPDRRLRIADETLEIYAPLAHRLGMWRFKWEMEDLAFRHKDPDKYEELSQKISKQRSEREAYAKQVICTLNDKLRVIKIKGEVNGRAKHFYSIYRKMVEEGKILSEIYDLIAVRVIVESIRDCYEILGVVHNLWKPIPGRFKDYIAMPKANMYQSLHTTVIGPDGEPFEIQIRTWEMHRTAEFGIAAHWRYKEHSKPDAVFDQKLAWLRQLLDWQKEPKDAREFMESLKIDLFDDEVFVFTPKGDVIDLPAGSISLDFAYQIHTDIGHHCVGAKINGKIAPLDTPLRNGDIVEIITSKQSTGPSWDWLNMVRTPGARSKIRLWFRKENREGNIQKGKDLVDKEVRRQGFSVDILSNDIMEEIRKRFNFTSSDDLMAAVGYGGLTPQNVVSKIKDEYKRLGKPLVPTEQISKARPKAKIRAGEGVLVHGFDNLLVRLSKCCNPIPGDPIMGFVTRGRGVSIHRLNCPNIAQFMEEPERLIEVSWIEQHEGTYPVEIVVLALDRPGLLSEVANTLADTRTNVISARLNAGRRKNGVAAFDMVIEIRDLNDLKYVIQRLHKLKDIMTVDRVFRDSGGRVIEPV